MPFFDYPQNNSGGRFHNDVKRGLGPYVVIEARDYKDANHLAEDKGLYFHGMGDCFCCGYRWGPQSSYDKGTPEPTIYGYTVRPSYNGSGFVHYLDGRIERVERTNVCL